MGINVFFSFLFTELNLSQGEHLNEINDKCKK